jgi:hypothetical protein
MCGLLQKNFTRRETNHPESTLPTVFMTIAGESGNFEGLKCLPSRVFPPPDHPAIGHGRNPLPKPMRLVQPDGLHRKWWRNGIAMHESYSNPAVFATGFSRLIDVLYCVCLWIALPLAVFTSNGWLGLLGHGLALTGAASFLEKPFSRSLTPNQGR